MEPRRVKAVHGARPPQDDPEFELALTTYLRENYDRKALLVLYGQYINGDGPLETTLRRALCRALLRRLGHDVRIGPGVGFKHPETIEIGDGVFIGAQAYLQGRYDGRCVIGNRVWIGPQAYFDACALVIEDDVGWGPGAKVLAFAHTGLPSDIPIIQTDLDIKPVRIETWADVGTNAVVMPGVTVGRGALVGAGAVVTSNVPPFAVVAGVPARFLRWRPGHEQPNPPAP
jgi:acetyltransferase-like isoleucine patch superfamily enzyme